VEIIFKKGNTKNSITCKRADGSATWSEADAFMIIHDLTHYAVESGLGMKQGFYGLVAGGLDITDFEKKQKIRPDEIPAEGLRAELLVGLVLTERNDGKEMNDFNEQYQELLKKFHLSAENIPLASVRRLREETDRLINKWKDLPVSSSLVFNFHPQ
jgi:hypothetical protein